MKFLLTAAAVLLACTASTAVAQLNISVANRVVAADSAYPVVIEVSGDVDLNAVSAAIGLGDGGTSMGGTETASIVGSSLDQSMWDVDANLGSVSTPSLLDVSFSPALPTSATVADFFGTTSLTSERAESGKQLIVIEVNLSTKTNGDTVAINPDFAGLTSATGPNLAPITIASATVGTLTIRPKGDANGDGVVNNLDIGGFILALQDTDAFIAANPLVDPRSILDFNGDRQVNNLDIGGFVAALTAN